MKLKAMVASNNREDRRPRCRMICAYIERERDGAVNGSIDAFVRVCVCLKPSFNLGEKR